MIDAKVLRLRKLRNVALRDRALARILDSDSVQEQSSLARSSVSWWTIARVASGRVRAHPYLSYQQGPSQLRDLADGVIASLGAFNARRQNRRWSVCAQQLQTVAREVDDVRALTWSPELSDALGRVQIQMPRVKVAAGAESGNSLDEMTADNSWPYLAIKQTSIAAGARAGSAFV